MKRIGTLLLCVVLLVAALPLSAVTVSAATPTTSGTTGDCKWTLSGTELTISGNGKMGDYNVEQEEFAPWGTGVGRVTIKEGVTSIGMGAFYLCTALEELVLPDSLVEIGDVAFCGCISLDGVFVPKNVKTIGAGAFSVCTDMQSAIIPYGVTTIGDMAFYMSKLTRVTIPSSVTYLGALAFGECTYLYEAKIGNGITYLAEGLFYNCKRMRNITFTDHVTVIKESAFEGCSSLHWLHYTGTKEQLDAITVEQGNEFADNITISTEHIEVISTSIKDCVYEGETASVLVDVIGNNIRYEWHFRDVDGKEEIADVTGNTYAVELTKETRERKVWCCIYDGNGNIRKESGYIVLLEKGRIVEQPQDAYAPMGERMTVTIKATGSNLRYTWYYKIAGEKKYTIAFNTTSSFTPKMSANYKDCQVYCVVTDGQGNKVKSNVVVLRETVSITTQPKTTYAKKGAVAKVPVKASGDGLTYQWYVKNPGSTKYVKSSIKSSTYSVKMTEAVNGRRVLCYVYDAYGNKVQTSSALIRMSATIVTQPKTVTVKKNATAKTTVKAAGDGLTYTWYIKNAGAKSFSKSSVKSATYSVKMTSKVKNRQIYCVVKDKYGKTVKSSTVTLKMK